MKKAFLSGLLFFSCLAGVFAQGIDEYNAALKLENQAKEAASSVVAGDMGALKKSAEAYIAAAKAYAPLATKNSLVRYQAAHGAFYNYYRAAVQYQKQGNFTSSYDALKKAFTFWTSLNDIPEIEITKPKTITYKENIVELGARTTPEERLRQYFESRNLAGRIAYSFDKYDEVLKYAKEVADEAHDMSDLVWESSYLTAASYHMKKERCGAARYSLRGISNASKIQPNGTDAEIEKSNEHIDDMLDYINQVDGTCLAPTDYEHIAIAAANLGGKWKDQSEKALGFGEHVYQENQTSSNELLFSMVNAAHKIKNDEAEKLWLKRLEGRSATFSTQEWKRLFETYTMLGMTEKANYSEKKAGSEGLGTTHILLSTNPYGLFMKQYWVFLNIMRPKVCHQLMFADIVSRDQYMQLTPSESEAASGKLGSSFTYLKWSGYMASYTVKLLSKANKRHVYPYIGPEIRYSTRNYFPEKVTLVNGSDARVADITAKSNAYDLSGIFGETILYKYFCIDLYIGVGVGYKSLEVSGVPAGTTIGFETWTPDKPVLDPRFKAARWNKLYVPARAGITIGIPIK